MEVKMNKQIKLKEICSPELNKYVDIYLTGLEFKEEEIPIEIWLQLGEYLKLMDKSVHWWLGDLLNYGEQNYGEMYTQVLDESDYAYQTLRDDKWVASKIELSLRKDNLSFSHHVRVADLDPEDQKYWLDKAEEENLSVRELRKEINKWKKEQVEIPPLPEGIYKIVYADPPWQYSDELIEGYGAAEHHYPTMSIDELCKMSLPESKIPFPETEDNAVLFLWVTSPMLEECFKVIKAWKFEYKTSFVWDKIKHNFGHYNSLRHEFLLICTKGSCVPEEEQLVDSVVSIERTEHSVKPDKFRDIIDFLYPSGKRIEMWARKKYIDLKKYSHWDFWGLEA